MRKLIVMLLLLLAPGLLLGAGEGRKVADRYTVPMDFVIANDCTGENIRLSGAMHVQYSAQETPQGWRAESMSNYQGVSAVGESSGRKYRVTGGGKSNVDFRRPYPAHSSVVQTVRLISQGSAPDSHYRLHWHYTINANGQMTAQFDRAEVVCRGR